MNYRMLYNSIVMTACVVSAAVLAYNEIEKWGWFLVMTVLLYVSGERKDGE